MNPDEEPWVEIARKVLAGQYIKEKKGSSVLASIKIGLRSINHPDCQKALEMIEGM